MDSNEKFLICVKAILEHEGKLSLDKRDPGGATNWGISLRYLKTMGIDIDGDGDIDEEDVIGLPQSGAKDIYKTYWWDKYRYDKFEDIEIAGKVFDMAVNMGAKTAHKLLQISINRIKTTAITVDGILGNQTFFAANSEDPLKIRQQLRQCAEHRYIEILADHPNMEWARKGWMKRAAW